MLPDMSTLKTIPLKAAQRRKFRSVEELMRHLGYGKGSLARFRRGLAETKLRDQLVLGRVRAGLTQGQVAEKMKCTQSRISKLEASLDADLSLGEVREYAAAVGLSLSVAIKG